MNLSPTILNPGKKLLFCLCIALVLPSLVRADKLDEQLLFLIPDREESRQTERQFFRMAFNDLVQQLRADKVGKRSKKKLIARLRERVTNNFLRTYTRDAELADFFRVGRYNDVSLALVYGLLLEQFGVSYAGIVDHWEVMVLADPTEVKFKLTAPGPARHEKKREKAFRYDFVELLNLTVIPGRRPTSEAGVDSLFQRYHYGKGERLDFDELSAYWHFHHALLQYRNGAFTEVIRSLEAARERDERPAFAALEQATYLQLAELDGDDGQQALFYFFELWQKDPGNTYIPSALLTAFVHTSNQLLKPGASFGKGEQLYQFLDSRGGDHPTWRNELRELYYLQKSRYFAAQNRYDQVMEYVDSLYVMRPDHPVIKKFVGSLSLRAVRASGTSGPELKRRLDELTMRYPFLLRHPAINDILLADQARAVRDLYEADNGYQGDSRLAVFRTQLNLAPADDRRSLWVLTAYVAASNYYFRSLNYAQARLLIEEALTFAPKEHYLLHRADVLRRY